MKPFFAKLRAFFHREKLDREMAEEMRFHLAERAAEHVADGTPPDEAHFTAQRRFGNPGLLQEQVRDQRRWVWLEQFFQDVQLGTRALGKNPGFTFVAVLTLALGIGATTAIFSVAYAVVLRPLPFPESERLVTLWTRTPQVERLGMAAANHRDLQLQNAVFEDIALLRGIGNYNLTGEGDPERLLASRIAANLFPLLRVQPMLGRGFTADETQPGRDHVAILSHGFWQRRYAGNPAIVGKTIHLENVPHLVVGVMGTGFQYPARDVQLWTPLTINPTDFQTRTGYAHLTVARLKPGVTLEQAQTEVNVIAARLEQQYPGPNAGVRFTASSLRHDMADVARRPLIVLLGAALGLLLIGCCNLVGLLLARALTRGRETAVRAALGATQSRLVRQSAAELLPIVSLGAITGVFAAKGGIAIMLPGLPATLPRLEEIQINLPVLVFSGAMLVVTAALVLWLPAVQTARADLRTTLGEGSRASSAAASKATLRNALVVGQVALTVMLLSGAGLLIRSFAALKNLDPGFRPEGVLSLQLAIPRNKYGREDKDGGDAKVAAFCQRILARVRALPGVETAGMGNRLPLGGASGVSSIFFERENQDPGMLQATDETSITPDYFRAMGIPLLRGRTFTELDRAGAPPVAIVDEEVARRAWPGQNPIGKRVRSSPDSPWAEVVGVVTHIRHESLDRDQRWQIYWNYLQRARDRITLVVRTTGDASLLAGPVLAAIKAEDPDQPAYAVRTMTDVVDESLALRRFHTVVVSLFAGSSLLLAMVGIYGVLAWTVRQRTREIGVRMALGAQRHAVLVLVLRHSLKLVGTGIGLGLLGAFALSGLLRSLLFSVGPTDPLTFAAVPALLVVAALIASWLPARRATHVNPLIALRSE